jgi:hypothetical protein
MNRWRIGIALSLSVLLAATSSLPVEASAATPGEVKVVLAELQVVKKNLPWSKASVKAARALITVDHKNIETELKRLKLKGAKRIAVTYEKQPLASESFADVETYGTAFLPWHFTANTPGDSTKAKSASFPRDQIDIAHYLTKLKKDDCSLDNFSIFNPATWFQPEKCQVISPTPSEFLRASLATALKKSTLDVGSYELARLKFALGPTTHLRLVGQTLICPELSPLFGGDTKIPLAESDGVGGYLISVDLQNRTSTFEFLGPDQVALASGATKNAGENFVRFFASQSTT